MMLIITALLLSLFTASPLDTQARPTEYYYNTLTRGIFKICTHAGVFSSCFSSHSGFLNFGRPLWLTRVNSLSLTLSPLKTQNRRGKCPRSTGTPSRTSTQIPGGGFGNTRRPERRLGTKFIFFLSCVFVLLKFSRFALDVMRRSVFGLSLSLSLFLSSLTQQHNARV
jgi:hypothetical protein